MIVNKRIANLKCNKSYDWLNSSNWSLAECVKVNLVWELIVLPGGEGEVKHFEWLEHTWLYDNL